MAGKRNVADNKGRAPVQSLACLGERGTAKRSKEGKKKKEANPKYEVKQVTGSGVI